MKTLLLVLALSFVAGATVVFAPRVTRLAAADSPSAPAPNTTSGGRSGNTALRIVDIEAGRRHTAELNRGTPAFWRAEGLLGRGDLDGAESAAREAIALSPHGGGVTAQAERLLGQIAMKRGRYEQALGYFLADDQPGRELGHGRDLDVALCYARLGNHQMARRYYSDRMVLRFAHDITARDLPGTRTPQALEASILLARGFDSYLSGGTRKAFENLQAAERLAPANGYIPYLAGRSLVTMGRHADAVRYFRKAMRHGRGEYADEAWRRVPDAPRYNVKDGYNEWNFRTPQQAERKRAEIRARAARRRL